MNTCRETIGESETRHFDTIARDAARLLDAPIGFVSLVGEDEVTPIGRHGSGDEPLVVHDALMDARFKELPPVRNGEGLRFHAGAPLVDRRSGMTVGAVCVADNAPRQTLSPADRDILENFARLASAELETAFAAEASLPADA